MPQFDLFSFFVQIYYVTLSFLIFYLCAEFYLLVKVSQTLKARKKSIELATKLLAAKNKRSEKELYNLVIKYFK